MVLVTVILCRILKNRENISDTYLFTFQIDVASIRKKNLWNIFYNIVVEKQK